MAIPIKGLVTLLFLITYLLVITNYKSKTKYVLAACLILIVSGVVTVREAISAINWNVIGIYVGMLFICETLIYSRFPEFLAEKIVNSTKNAKFALLGICAVSGFLSIFLENVAVVLIMAPIAFSLARNLEIDPKKIIIGIAICSNLQGVATLIGDPPSLLLAAHAKLTFNDFFIFMGKPSLFFAVQLGFIISLGVLYYIFQEYKEKTKKIREEKIRSITPLLILVTLVFLLSAASIVEIKGEDYISNIIEHNKLGIISLFCGGLCFMWYYFENREDFVPMFKRVDWETGFFLMGVFIMVFSLIKTNVIRTIASAILPIIGNNVFLAYIFIITISLFFSAFVDNVPYLAAMLPLVENLASHFGTTPYVLYFGLLIGASIGGNITPIGASANIVAMGLLKRHHKEPDFYEFVNIGLPFTIAATLVSAAFIWLFFGV